MIADVVVTRKVFAQCIVVSQVELPAVTCTEPACSVHSDHVCIQLIIAVIGQIAERAEGVRVNGSCVWLLPCGALPVVLQQLLSCVCLLFADEDTSSSHTCTAQEQFVIGHQMLLILLDCVEWSIFATCLTDAAVYRPQLDKLVSCYLVLKLHIDVIIMYSAL